MKSYIGESRPCGEYNKTLLTIMERNLVLFNADKRKGILTVEHFIAGGDQWKILVDGKEILSFMSLEECHYAVAGIINYTNIRR